LNLERIKTLVAAEAKKTYYETCFSQEIIDGLEEQLHLLQDVQRLLSDRYQAGASNYLDVIRGKVEIARLNNDIAEAKRDLQTRKAQLNLLLGNDADHVLVLTDSLLHSPSFVDEDSLMRTLLEKSSALKIAQRTVFRQEAAVGLAKTSYLPDFSLGIFHQRRAEEPPFNANQFTGTTTNALGIELGISIPLWFWQEPKGQVQEASALRSIAEVNNSHVARRVRASILNAIAAVKVADAQIRVFDESLLNDTRDIVTTGIAQYQNNQIDLLNLLDIYRTARATRVEYARALLNYTVAFTDLEAAGELPFEE
ncbi:MAG: TolC family protein, partial [Bacteroidota bacterium]